MKLTWIRQDNKHKIGTSNSTLGINSTLTVTVLAHRNPDNCTGHHLIKWYNYTQFKV